MVGDQIRKGFTNHWLLFWRGASLMQSFIQSVVLFSINDSDEGAEWLLIRFAGAASEDRTRLQDDLDRLENWAKTNQNEFQEVKIKTG